MKIAATDEAHVKGKLFKMLVVDLEMGFVLSKETFHFLVKGFVTQCTALVYEFMARFM